MTTDQKQGFKLGDAVARLTKLFHIPHCPKCEKRRLILNEIQKVGIKETIRRLKAAGLVEGGEAVGKGWSVDELVRKMKECCGKDKKEKEN